MLLSGLERRLTAAQQLSSNRTAPRASSNIGSGVNANRAPQLKAVVERLRLGNAGTGSIGHE